MSSAPLEDDLGNDCEKSSPPDITASLIRATLLKTVVMMVRPIVPPKGFDTSTSEIIAAFL
jgi:hypothetical protein